MNYIEARRAEKLFREYKAFAIAYWKAKPDDDRDYLEVHDREAPESDESRRLRERVNLLFPEVNHCAASLGIDVVVESYPAPAIGGPVIPVNLLLSVIDQEMGHGPVTRQRIMDQMNRCIGVAEATRRGQLRRLFMPWYWFIDVPAFFVRLPFRILRAAGLPKNIEDHIAAHVVKAVLVGTLLLLGGFLGIRMTVPDLLTLFKK